MQRTADTVRVVTVPPNEPTGEPSVIARLAEQQERRFVRRPRSRGSRVTGWIVIAAIAALVVEAAVRVHPW